MPRARLTADWTKAEIAHLRRLLAEGYSVSRIAQRLQRAHESIMKKATENGLTLPAVSRRDARAGPPMAKLSNAIASVLFRLRRGGALRSAQADTVMDTGLSGPRDLDDPFSDPKAPARIAHVIAEKGCKEASRKGAATRRGIRGRARAETPKVMSRLNESALPRW
jgi:hypothetical protein